MNIQKINSTQNFGAIIGPKLQAEINRKREEIHAATGQKRHVGLDRFEQIVKKIEELFPSYNNSPVTVDIKVRDVKKKNKNNRKIQITKKQFYQLTSADGNFFKQFPRINDGKTTFDRYAVLLDKLEKFDIQEASGELTSDNKPISRRRTSRFSNGNLNSSRRNPF